jgi:DNA-binding NtrC family response regulator
MDLALKFAVPDINILLLGETGTGKELFARTIHAASKRGNGPFVAVDCSMLAENLIESELFGHEKGSFTGATCSRIGRFEMAQGGTLFLDEIGNLPITFQAKLLRVLQERCVERVGGRDTVRLDVRIVSATNVNLKEAITAGKFRQDLYYRLQEMTICLPPLRERREDIESIAKHFLSEYSARFGTGVHGIANSALSKLRDYDWPGNVRELENVVKAAAICAVDSVQAEHLPTEIREYKSLAKSLLASMPIQLNEDENRLRVEIDLGLRNCEIDLKALGAEAAEKAERSLLMALLRRGHMNGTQMARMLGIDPKTLRTKLRRYGLEAILVTDN